MVRHNNVVPFQHFHKDWDRRVKTWFNQPARKLRRRSTRLQKAAAIFPNPASGLLRPIVRCPTAKYNIRPRLGRGFTLEELKGAGLTKYAAKQVGIAVDYRRRTSNEAALKQNVQRLTTYKSKLVVFPQKTNKGRKGLKKGEKPVKKQRDAAQDAAYKAAVQQKEQLPFAITHRSRARVITAEEKKASAFETIVQARLAQRKVGEKDKKKDALEGGAAPAGGDDDAPAKKAPAKK